MKKQPGIPDRNLDDQLPPSEETSMELPEVKYIPGQEHIHVLPTGDSADTATSPADEEEETDDDLDLDGDDNVTDQERRLLDDAASSDPDYEDERHLHEALPDDTDDDGDPLNEDDALDVPGSEDDDEAEDIGSEDEENNGFSIDKNSD
ncbi:hypothetical protein [Chitinophaga rhizosphaerae]|uniref:hypothetical protein n=1 Tax=Chitinophaga rhizosphaerae TaxID=1864947 RepID=UPI000F809A90|nr:hypothetical protein [Chitinophaga rhizosphaerae]